MISIIVPFYCTRKEYFDRCMISLLADKDANIEVLLVDDGSTDEYKRYFSEYTLDRRVRILYENHKGVSNARNVGIQEAKGEWLMFVDSDDYLETGYAAVLSNFIEDTDADIILFNGFGDRYGKIIKNKYFIQETLDYGKTVDRKCLVAGAGLSLGRTPDYYRCFYTLGAPYSKLINTSFLKQNGIKFDTNVKFAEDTLFSMNLFMKAEHIYYSDVYLYHYYMNEDSVTGKYRRGLSEEMEVFFSKARDFIEVNNLWEHLKESYYIRAFLEIQRCIRQEYCHKQNEDKNRYEKAKELIKQEPYHSGINSRYQYMRRWDSRLAAFMLKHGLIRSYVNTYNVLLWMRGK